MTLFSRKSTTRGKEVKFVGVHFPLHLNTYITLYAMTMETSKSAIICNELEAWNKANEKTMSIDAMVAILVKKAIGLYESGRVHNSAALRKFLIDIRKELIIKGIDTDVVTKIIKQIQNGAD